MGIPADSAFVLTLMGSLTRMLDRGLSLTVVVETPNYISAVTVSPLPFAVLQKNFLRNDTVLAVNEWPMWCEGKIFMLAYSWASCWEKVPTCEGRFLFCTYIFWPGPPWMHSAVNGSQEGFLAGHSCLTQTSAAGLPRQQTCAPHLHHLWRGCDPLHEVPHS